MLKPSPMVAAGPKFPAAEWAGRTSASAGSAERAADSARFPAEVAAACSATAGVASREAWKSGNLLAAIGIPNRNSTVQQNPHTREAVS